jgi:serine/threonine protein phosphatase 1
MPARARLRLLLADEGCVQRVAAVDDDAIPKRHEPDLSLTYVIPDLHGRLDLLCEALERIVAHAGGQAGTIVMLGDYVDKGPDSKGVVDRLLSGIASGWKFFPLKGNHDAMMVRALRDPAAMDGWLAKGGGAALASYGGAQAAVPQSHVVWIDQLPLVYRDRYRLYVHAGVDAGIPLSQQAEQTLLNKRYPPGDRSGFGELHVVHGHDNFPEGPLLHQDRSNLDTQAWRTGRLVIGIFDDAKAGGPMELIEIHGLPANG